MKKVLGVFCLIVAIVLAVFLVPVNDVAVAGRVLTAPTNIQLKESGEKLYITWECVENNGFTVKIDDNTADVAKNVTEYDVSDLTAGASYSVSVKALGADGVEDSEYSTAKTIVISKKLSNPQNISVSDEKVLSWDAVTSAEGYTVIINGVKVATKQSATSLSISDKLTSVGDYTIKVKAVGNNSTILDSAYTKKVYTNKQQLPAPTNVSANVAGAKVTWDAVDNANKYSVVIDNGTPIAVSTNEISMADYTEVKDYKVKVKALENGNYTESDFSAEITYSVTATIDTPVLSFDDSTKVVSWTTPTGASKYSVSVTKNGTNVVNEAEYSTTSYDLTSVISDVGYYLIEVSANKNGNYNQSDIADYTYYKYETLSTPVLTITGTVVSWTAVDNAVNYTVYVGGVLRTSTLSATSYDFADDIGEYGDYEIKVLANGNGWYNASAYATTTYTYEESGSGNDPAGDDPQTETVKYYFNITPTTPYVIFVDNVKTEYALDENNCLTLSSTATKVIIAPTASALKDAIDNDTHKVNVALYQEITLDKTTYNESVSAYSQTINSTIVNALSEDTCESTELGFIEDGGNYYYYYMEEGKYVPKYVDRS